MNVTRARVVLRERPLPDILDLALRFLVEHGGAYAKTGVMVLPPFLATSILIARFTNALAAWLFCVFGAALAAAPFTVLASRLVFEDDVRPGSVVRAALVDLPRLCGLRLLSFGLFVAGLSVCTLPGVWVAAITFFAVEVASLEKARTLLAFERSFRLARCASSEVLMAILVLATLHLSAVMMADTAGRTLIEVLLEAHTPAAIWEDGWSVLGLAGFWLFVPYVATTRFFVYLDVRTRTEGWDIQTRFVALAARSLPEPGAAS
jgi:hypothetical protein